MTSLFSLDGKVALVTGSTRGIGLAVAERLLESGARVIVSSRKVAACNEIVARLRARYLDAPALGPRIVGFPCDIRCRQDIETLAREAIAFGGGVDILVCNAAVNGHFGSCLSVTDEAFRNTFDANVLSTLWLCQLLLPGMVSRGGGRIVIVSSIAALSGTTTIGIYGLTKAADAQLVRNLAAEYGRQGIRANGIAPGLVRTDMARALWENPEYLRAYEAANPSGRIATPDEIAGVAVFLASPAAAYVNGQTIVVDGGATVVHQ